MTAPTIGLQLMVKNEEAAIRGCLESVKGIDEMIVLDTGSTDKTGEVARECGADFREGLYEWKNDFGDARTFSMRQCKTDWILCIDADERLDPGGLEKIREAIAAAPLSCGGFQIMKYQGNDQFWCACIFRNRPDIGFNGKIHESPNVLGVQKLEGVRIQYNPSPNHTIERNLNIIEPELRKDPNNIRMQYCAAREYFIYQYFPDAIYWLERYVRMVLKNKLVWVPELADAYWTLAVCYRKMDELDQAEKCFLDAIKLNADFKECFDGLAEIAAKKGNKLNQERWELIASTAQNRELNFKTKGVF